MVHIIVIQGLSRLHFANLRPVADVDTFISPEDAPSTATAAEYNHAHSLQKRNFPRDNARSHSSDVCIPGRFICFNKITPGIINMITTKNTNLPDASDDADTPELLHEVGLLDRGR